MTAHAHGHADDAAENPAIYGLMAEFDSPEEVLKAARAAKAGGYSAFDTYTPFPVEGLDETFPGLSNHVGPTTFAGGLLGGLGGFLFMCWSAIVYYPHNIAGKPLYSWPAFIPITFELTILGGSLAAVFGMLAYNGFPLPYHPVFNAPGFDLATDDRFFLCVQSEDPSFDPAATLAFLEGLGPRSVSVVPY